MAELSFTKYIDREGIYTAIASVEKLAKSDKQKALLGRVLYIVDHYQSTVDAEPVVRCKNCFWWHPEDKGLQDECACAMFSSGSHTRYMPPYGFCSEGEPKEGIQ